MSSPTEDLAEKKKKKHVRFARMHEEEEDNNPEQEEEEEEDTLFDKRKDVKAGLKSALKRGKRLVHSSTGEKVEVKDGGGVCRRWMVTLTLCASFLGLVMSRFTLYHSQHADTHVQDSDFIPVHGQNA